MIDRRLVGLRCAQPNYVDLPDHGGKIVRRIDIGQDTRIIDVHTRDAFGIANQNLACAPITVEAA